MKELLEENDIRFVPGLNEELAATAVWGSQIDLPAANAKYDGITGFWYGKGPGVDRATDALRHANMYGVNRRGGAVLLVGDDPASKSSSVPAVSERSLAALGIPVLFPRNATEIVTLGLHAIDIEATRISAFGRPAGYLARQVARFASLWDVNTTRVLPDVDLLAGWLADNVPHSADATASPTGSSNIR